MPVKGITERKPRKKKGANKMFAKYLNEENKVVPCVVEKAPRWISELYTGKAIPVVAGNKLMLATYEKEINSLFVHGEISRTEIMAKACEEGYKRYVDAITTVYENNKDYITEVFKELNKLDPPWNE